MKLFFDILYILVVIGGTIINASLMSEGADHCSSDGCMDRILIGLSWLLLLFVMPICSVIIETIKKGTVHISLEAVFINWIINAMVLFLVSMQDCRGNCAFDVVAKSSGYLLALSVFGWWIKYMVEKRIKKKKSSLKDQFQ